MRMLSNFPIILATLLVIIGGVLGIGLTINNTNYARAINQLAQQNNYSEYIGIVQNYHEDVCARAVTEEKSRSPNEPDSDGLYRVYLHFCENTVYSLSFDTPEEIYEHLKILAITAPNIDSVVGKTEETHLSQLKQREILVGEILSESSTLKPQSWVPPFSQSYLWLTIITSLLSPLILPAAFILYILFANDAYKQNLWKKLFNGN